MALKKDMIGRAAVFTGPGLPLEVRDYPVTPPGGRDVLLSLRRSGITRADIRLLEGRLPAPAPLIPGSEFIGEVRAVNPEAKQDALGNVLDEGCLVLACMQSYCAEWLHEVRGRNELAPDLSALPRNPETAPHFFGAFSEFLYWPASRLIRLPKRLDLDAVAAFLTAGPLMIRVFLEAGGLQKKEFVVVQGTGPLGLFAVAWAVNAGCRVLAVGSGRQAPRWEAAKQLGARMVLDRHSTSVDDRVEAIRHFAEKLGHGDGADVVVEASGNTAAITEGLQMARTGGRYLLAARPLGPDQGDIDPRPIIMKELRLSGLARFGLAEVSGFLDFLKNNTALQEKLSRCLSHRFSIAEANDACKAVSGHDAIKAVFSD
ncbi:MAG: zinc-binding dehydrogenase [Lentisphaerae bacterium]|nr:zinc-binding dehydrogenase [Lentisphaerota bacterium]